MTRAFVQAEGSLSYSRIAGARTRGQGRRMDDYSTVAFVAVAFVIAGFVKGVVGLGLPTVVVGLLSLTMTPAQAAALLVIPSLVTNVWQAAGPNLPTLLRRLWPMLLAVCIGLWLCAGIFAADNSGVALMVLGIVLALYALFGLTAPQLSVPARVEPWLAPAIGAITGALTAVTGIFVIPAVPYLQALALSKDELVQALGISFTVSTIALAIVLALNGVMQISVVGTSLIALAPALLGMWLGQFVRARVRPELFRVCFFLGLLMLGLHLALHGLF